MESPCESLFTYKFHFCKETLGYSDFPFFHWKLVFQTYGAFIVLFSGFQPFTNTCPFKGLFWIPRVFSKESLFWLIGMHACPALCELCEICSLHRLGYSLNRLEDFWSHFSAWISLLHYIALQISSYFCLPELWVLSPPLSKTARRCFGCTSLCHRSKMFPGKKLEDSSTDQDRLYLVCMQ